LRTPRARTRCTTAIFRHLKPYTADVLKISSDHQELACMTCPRSICAAACS
jgi:hypothetical protein